MQEVLQLSRWLWLETKRRFSCAIVAPSFPLPLVRVHQLETKRRLLCAIVAPLSVDPSASDIVSPLAVRHLLLLRVAVSSVPELSFGPESFPALFAHLPSSSERRVALALALLVFALLALVSLPLAPALAAAWLPSFAQTSAGAVPRAFAVVVCVRVPVARLPVDVAASTWRVQ